jgi:radical SAM superfamily enzyme YgiQ (UPF0313 family)
LETQHKPRIVLFRPRPFEQAPYYGLPLALLSVAALPHAAGYDIRIIAQDIDDDCEQRVLEACDGALLFGVTSLTGYMIKMGLNMCAKVRERYPDLPIVWGGTHPTIAPDQTCAHPLVDIVVVGQGEATFMDLVEAMAAGRSPETVAGLRIKQKDGRVISTGCRPTVDLDSLPRLPFELLDMQRYVDLHSSTLKGKFKGMRSTTLYSSYGCPFTCTFCSEPMTSSRRWYSKRPERVIEELLELKKQGVTVVAFQDPIFFIDLKRARRIAELMIENEIGMLWTATSRLESIKKIDESMWDVLKRSGFVQVFIGIESAHPVVLKSIGKKYTADDIVETARILGEHDVSLVSSMIQGLPVDESPEHLRRILKEDMRLAARTLLRVIEVNPKVGIGIMMYTPYPGSVAYELSIKHGFVPPKSLEGWASFHHYENQVPWMLPEQELFTNIAPLAQAVLKGRARRRFRRPGLGRAIVSLYGAVTRIRYRHGYFKLQVEQKAMLTLARIVLKRRGRGGHDNWLI